jgi:choline dehydrogenase-like flavoprotein
MQSTTFDAIVVGSGISGGWAAKELAEKGLNTLCLEAGRPIDPAIDYVEHVPAYEMAFRGLGDRKQLERYQPVQRTCYACDEYSGKFFVNDLDNPYTTPDDRPFSWIRGRQVGGRSIAWGRQCYRWSDLDFEANAREGVGVDWPIRYRDIAPWYDHVERFVGLQGNREGLAHLPDGQFLPPFPLNCAEERLRDTVRQRFGGERLVTNARVAILSQAHNGRQACHFCGPCERGCATFSYFNSVHVTLPAAQATGRFTLRPFSVVHSVLFDPATRRATGVRVIDANTRQVTEYRARVVFLCASTLESARILMNSATLEFPDGLANSSGVLGRYLMDHIMGGGANGVVPWLADRKTVGNARSGFYIPRFRNVTGGIPISSGATPFRDAPGGQGGIAGAAARASARISRRRSSGTSGPGRSGYTASVSTCPAPRTARRSTRTWWTRGASPRCASTAGTTTTRSACSRTWS